MSVQGIIVYRGSYFGLYDTGKGALLTKVGAARSRLPRHRHAFQTLTS